MKKTQAQTARPWLWQGREFTTAPEEWLGFVYLITSPSGKMYVGKKLFWSRIRRKPLKGTRRVRIERKESDWRKYFGSSNELVAELGRTGRSFWTREILHLCESKWECSFAELKIQLALNALVRTDFFNSIIHVRLNQPPSSFTPSRLDATVARVQQQYGGSTTTKISTCAPVRIRSRGRQGVS
jgi:hypothetical protein